MSTHDHASLAPSPWIVRFGALVPGGARMLDLACGHGRHARWFASRGARVVAVDRDAAALATLQGIEGVEARMLDLEGAAWPLAGERFDAIVVVNYLYRRYFDAILAALADDGALLYETFATGNEAFGKPSNPEFLLRPGELLDRTTGKLVVVAFEQGHVRSADRDQVVQRIAAVGAKHRWPPALP
ncbi:MAG TPA: class I SAM-dependent methyltransferase [Casimicrobiaceae bacterium]|nr:class I SAM-dependent methyltransferase [Casimicrobiaceae bacterium]